jgi:hypothetical protein
MLNSNWTDSVHHDGSAHYVSGNVNSPGTAVTLRLHTGLDAPIERIFVRISPDGEQRFLPMHQVATDTEHESARVLPKAHAATTYLSRTALGRLPTALRRQRNARLPTRDSRRTLAYCSPTQERRLSCPPSSPRRFTQWHTSARRAYWHRGRGHSWHTTTRHSSAHWHTNMARRSVGIGSCTPFDIRPPRCITKADAVNRSLQNAIIRRISIQYKEHRQ